jgi:hypothetical protein
MQDYLFDAATGFYLGNRPAGWEWGSAEVDADRHVIIRTDNPAMADAVDDLTSRKLRLADKGEFISGNAWSKFSLQEAPVGDWLEDPAYISLDTGEEYASWGEVLASCPAPGSAFFLSPRPSDPDAEGVVRVALGDLDKVLTLPEAMAKTAEVIEAIGVKLSTPTETQPGGGGGSEAGILSKLWSGFKSLVRG